MKIRRDFSKNGLSDPTMADTNEESGEQPGAVDPLVDRGVGAGANNRSQKSIHQLLREYTT